MQNYIESAYKVMLTNIGLDLVEKAMANQARIELKYMAFRDNGNPDWKPVGNETTSISNYPLIKEILSKSAQEGTVRYTSVISSSDETGTFNEVGLFVVDPNADEDASDDVKYVLFAVANIPTLEHVKEKGAVTETKITVVLAAENAQYIEVTIPSAIYITEEDANNAYLRKDGNNLPDADINMNSHKLTGLEKGTHGSDAATVDQVLPIGAIYLFAGLNLPTNAVRCDGSAYNKQGEFSSLWNTIGNMYTSKDNQTSTTFRVPNIAAPDDGINNYLTYVIKYKA